MAVTGAINQYWQNLRPRAGTLPETIPQYLVDQFNSSQYIYRLLWQHFDGTKWLEKNEYAREKWPLKINFSQAASFIHTATWAGDMPDTSDPVVKPVIELSGGRNAKAWAQQATDALQQVWYENHGRALLLNANVICQALGGVVLKLRWDPNTGWRRKTPIRLEVITPDIFIGVPDAGDPYDLVEAYVIRQLAVDYAEKVYGFIPTRDDRDRKTVQMVEHWDRYTWRITINGQVATFKNNKQDGSNRWGFVPMVYFPHLRYAGVFPGIPLFAQLMGLAEEFNGRMADEGDAILKTVHATPWMRNVRDKVATVRVGNTNVLDLGISSATSGPPELMPWPAPEMAKDASGFNAKLENTLKELLFTPEVAWGNDPGSQRSGESRDRLLLPLTMHIGMEREHWTPGLNVLSEMMLHMLAKGGGENLKITERHLGHRIHQVWYPMYPADRAKLVEEAVVRAQAFLISPEHALEQLGDTEDVDAELQRIKDFHAWKAEQAKPPSSEIDRPAREQEQPTED